MMNQMNEEKNNEMPDIVPDELAQCTVKAQEYLNGWQRAKADFVNYKNDEARRLEDTARFMTRSLMQDLLPLLDSFELALKHFGAEKAAGESEHEKGATPRVHTDAQGMLLIRLQMMDILKKRGLETIALKVGDSFNPEKHEALGEMEADVPSGTVAEEIQKGYMLQGRVLRPARVRVAK